MDLEKQIDERIRVLNNPKESAALRRDAAYWLGEVAAAKAISVLARVYKSDRDPTVKAAAADALGVFKALQVALEKGDSRLEMVTKRIESGKAGSRPRISASVLSRITTVMIVLLVLLIAANIVLRLPASGTGETSQQVAAVTSKDRATLLAELRDQFNRLQADTINLQRQYTSLMGGGELDCSGFFNDPAPYQLAPEDAAQHTDIAAITDQFNAALSSLSPSRQRFIQACLPNSTPIPGTDVGTVMAGVVQTLNALPVIDAAIATALLVPTATLPSTDAPVAEASATPDATATDASTPTPTEEPVDLRGHLGRLYNIVDEITGARGANTILEQRWQEVATGNTSGCNQIAPIIPADYTITDDEAATAPTLKQAVEQINLGLAQTRQGWQLFTNSCTAGSGSSQANLGLQVAKNASDAFGAALALMDSLQTSS